MSPHTCSYSEEEEEDDDDDDDDYDDDDDEREHDASKFFQNLDRIDALDFVNKSSKSELSS